MGFHRPRSNGYVHTDTRHTTSAIDILSGYQMAKNLQAKLPANDTINIHDIDENISKRFAQEVAGTKGAAVKIANCVREATEPSVSLHILSSLPIFNPLYDEFVPNQ